MSSNEITIRFIAGSDIVSKLIEFTTDSLFCHTEALSRDGSHWIGAHAKTGVEARPLNWCKPEFGRRYSIPVTPALYEQGMYWLESKLGTPYDYADIVGLALHSRKGGSDHEIICSALMIQFMQQTGLQPLNCLEQFAYLITPETLHLSPVFIGRGVAA